MEAIFKRRSVRKYLEKKVENEKVEKLIRAAMQAPSAGNQQAWEFVVVREKKTLEKLSHVNPYAKMTAEADLAIVVLANEEYMRNPLYWQQDLGACVENLMLQAVEEELGSVWIGVAPREDRITHIQNIFSLPETVIPYAVIPIGYPSEKSTAVDRWDPNKVHYEEYKSN